MAEPQARVFLSFDPSDQAAALDLIDRLRLADIERVIHLPDADSAIVLARDDHLGNAQDLEGIHYRAQESEFVLVPVVLGGADTSRWPGFLRERQAVNLHEPGGPERVVDALSQPPIGPLPALTPSVEEARRRVVERLGDAVAQYELAVEIARIHPEYGGGLAASLPSGRYAGHFREGTADEWLREVRGLVSERGAPTLHGRAVMLALGLLAPDLRRVYQTVGFEDALVAEIREPLDELLTERGRALWEEGEPRFRTLVGFEESVPSHTDNPATVDQLGREGIARLLARRIRQMRAQEVIASHDAQDGTQVRGRSFLIHLQAPWGMGKTSLLNLLEQELRRTDEHGARESGDPWSYGPWIVIDFNAWRHQWVNPPWWSLMTDLYQQGRSQLRSLDASRSRRFWLREWTWRIWVGWPRFVILLLVLIGILLIVRAGWIQELWGTDDGSGGASDFLIALAAVVAASTAIWATLRSAGRWLMTTSASGARQFVDQTGDPTGTIRSRFSLLMAWLDYPVLIRVDDLDRCRGDYVVRLLEGIQTLFRDQPVAYVVAADRDWLSDSYQVAYRRFVSANKPGRPLGYLFLEKVFQMSVTLPAPSQETHARFWDRLLRPGERIDSSQLEVERRDADATFSGLRTEAAIRSELDINPGSTPAQRQARLEAAALQLASPVIAEEAEHALQPFANLLDANPRAMKRLVNAYGIARGLETLHGEALGDDRAAQQQTALWTILMLRWPRLADYLALFPEDVTAIQSGNRPPEGAPSDLVDLFMDRSVIAVVRGDAEGIDVQLDPDAIWRRAGQAQV